MFYKTACVRKEVHIENNLYLLQFVYTIYRNNLNIFFIRNIVQLLHQNMKCMQLHRLMLKSQHCIRLSLHFAV